MPLSFTASHLTSQLQGGSISTPSTNQAQHVIPTTCCLFRFFACALTGDVAFCFPCRLSRPDWQLLTLRALTRMPLSGRCVGSCWPCWHDDLQCCVLMKWYICFGVVARSMSFSLLGFFSGGARVHALAARFFLVIIEYQGRRNAQSWHWL